MGAANGEISSFIAGYAIYKLRVVYYYSGAKRSPKTRYNMALITEPDECNYSCDHTSTSVHSTLRLN